MDKQGEKVRLQVIVDKPLADKIDELAGKMHMSRSEFVAAMIEENIGCEEWMVKFVTSRFMEPVRQVIRMCRNRAARRKAASEGA